MAAQLITGGRVATPEGVLDPGWVLVDDGNVGLVVEHIDGEDVVCTVTEGGKVSNNKGMSLPGMNVNSYGELAPIGDNKSAQGRSQNRRVALVVLK